MMALQFCAHGQDMLPITIAVCSTGHDKTAQDVIKVGQLGKHCLSLYAKLVRLADSDIF
jgi:hypothetical protein